MSLQHGTLLSSVKQVVAEMNAEGAKVAGKEWDIIPVAVPRKCFHVPADIHAALDARPLKPCFACSACARLSMSSASSVLPYFTCCTRSP